MAKVLISLDTETHAVVATIDGKTIDTQSLNLSKWPCGDGEEKVNFSYSQTVKDANGMEMVNYWYLPEKEDMEDMMGEGKCGTKKKDESKCGDKKKDESKKCKTKASAGVLDTTTGLSLVTGTQEEVTARMCAAHLMNSH